MIGVTAGSGSADRGADTSIRIDCRLLSGSSTMELITARSSARASSRTRGVVGLALERVAMEMSRLSATVVRFVVRLVRFVGAPLSVVVVTGIV